MYRRLWTTAFPNARPASTWLKTGSSRGACRPALARLSSLASANNCWPRRASACRPLGLAENPQPSLAVNAWQNVVQPLSVGTLGLSIGVTALTFIVARREHAREKALLKAKEASNDKPNAA